MAQRLTWVLDTRTDATLHLLRVGQQTYCGRRPQHAPVTPKLAALWTIVEQPDSAQPRCMACLAALDAERDAHSV